MLFFTIKRSLKTNFKNNSKTKSNQRYTKTHQIVHLFQNFFGSSMSPNHLCMCAVIILLFVYKNGFIFYAVARCTPKRIKNYRNMFSKVSP